MRKFHVEIFRAIIWLAVMTLVMSAVMVIGTLGDSQ